MEAIPNQDLIIRTINDIGADAVQYIFQYLDYKFIILTCGCVSTEWRYAVSNTTFRNIKFKMEISMDTLSNMLDWPFISNIVNLDFKHRLIGNNGVSLIANCPHLTNLHDLEIGSCLCRYEGAKALGCSQFLSNLIVLNISFNNLGDEGIKIIVNNIYRKLEFLNVSCCGIGDIGAIAIANSKYMCNLKHLDLLGNNVKQNGANAIGDSSFLSKLTYLDLNFCGVGNVGANSIASSHNMSKLQLLNLQKNGLIEVSSIVNMKNLVTLDLGRNDLGEKVIQVFKSQYMCNLTELNISLCKLRANSMQALSESPLMSNLSKLNLGINFLGYEGAEFVSSSQYLTNLTCLNLCSNNLGDRGIVAIFNSKYMSNLTELNITDDSVGLEGAKAIAQTEFITNLTKLNLYESNIGKEGADLILSSPKLLKLRILDYKN